MAKPQKKEELVEEENVTSILGKIKKVVSGKDSKVPVDGDVFDEDLREDLEEINNDSNDGLDEDEPLELTEIMEAEEKPENINNIDASEDNDINAKDSQGENIVKNSTVEEKTEALGDESEEDDSDFMDILEEIDSELEKQYASGNEAEVKNAEEYEKEENSEEKPDIENMEEQESQSMVEEAEKTEEILKEDIVELSDSVEENIPDLKNEVEEAIDNSTLETTPAPNPPQKKNPEPEINQSQNSKLLSEDIAEKSSRAIKNLVDNIPKNEIDSPAFRSAVTLEDLAVESLKPLLKVWLDENLETVVRDIVEKEIKKIIPKD